MIDIHQQQQFKKLCAAYMEWCSLHATFKKLSAAYIAMQDNGNFSNYQRKLSRFRTYSLLFTSALVTTINFKYLVSPLKKQTKHTFQIVKSMFFCFVHAMFY